MKCSELLVVAAEADGAAADFVDMMARAKAREAPAVLQWSVHLSWRRRWMHVVNFMCSRVRELFGLQCGRLDRCRRFCAGFG